MYILQRGVGGGRGCPYIRGVDVDILTYAHSPPIERKGVWLAALNNNDDLRIKFCARVATQVGKLLFPFALCNLL